MHKTVHITAHLSAAASLSPSATDCSFHFYVHVQAAVALQAGKRLRACTTPRRGHRDSTLPLPSYSEADEDVERCICDYLNSSQRHSTASDKVASLPYSLCRPSHSYFSHFVTTPRLCLSASSYTTSARGKVYEDTGNVEQRLWLWTRVDYAIKRGRAGEDSKQAIAGGQVKIVGNVGQRLQLILKQLMSDSGGLRDKAREGSAGGQVKIVGNVEQRLQLIHNDRRLMKENCLEARILFFKLPEEIKFASRRVWPERSASGGIFVPGTVIMLISICTYLNSEAALAARAPGASFTPCALLAALPNFDKGVLSETGQAALCWPASSAPRANLVFYHWPWHRLQRPLTRFWRGLRPQRVCQSYAKSRPEFGSLKGSCLPVCRCLCCRRNPLGKFQFCNASYCSRHPTNTAGTKKFGISFRVRKARALSDQSVNDECTDWNANPDPQESAVPPTFNYEKLHFNGGLNSPRVTMTGGLQLLPRKARVQARNPRPPPIGPQPRQRSLSLIGPIKYTGVRVIGNNVVFHDSSLTLCMLYLAVVPVVARASLACKGH
ncbi:hypothetical protein J6590_071391 [Homalodisca vitripennis]|nr:hypothetical protein J6590_071391 [Homalodisca vitripennis]